MTEYFQKSSEYYQERSFKGMSVEMTVYMQTVCEDYLFLFAVLKETCLLCCRKRYRCMHCLTVKIA